MANTADWSKHRDPSGACGPEQRRDEVTDTDEVTVTTNNFYDVQCSNFLWPQNQSSSANIATQDGERASSRTGVKKQRRYSVVHSFCWICAVLVCCKGPIAETESCRETAPMEMQLRVSPALFNSCHCAHQSPRRLCSSSTTDYEWQAHQASVDFRKRIFPRI